MNANVARALLSIAIAAVACSDGPGLDRLQLAAEFEPAALEFGEVPIGLVPSRAVELRNIGPVNFTIEDAVVPDGYSVLDVKNQLLGRTIAPGNALAFEVAFVSTEEGPRSGTLLLSADREAFELPVSGSGVFRPFAKLVVDPSSIDFGTIEVDRRVTSQVVLTNTGVVDAEVTDVDVGAPDVFRITTPRPFTVPVGQAVTVDVEFLPNREAEFSDTMRFSTGLDSVSLSLRGSSIRPEGDILCEPAALEFGRVVRGEIGSRTVDCTAVGGPARIVRTRIAQPDTSGFQLPMVLGAVDLQAGESISIAVDFAADGLPGAREDRLLVDYAGGTAIGTFSVALSGEVIAPPPERNDFTIVLNWDTATDVDLHLVRPGGSMFVDADDCHYGSRSPDWGELGVTTDNPFLDRDDLDGFGPETINLADAPAGRYSVWAHHYSALGLSVTAEPSVSIFLGGVMVGTFTQPVACGFRWLVGIIEWDGDTGAFTPDLSQTFVPGRGQCL